MSHQKRIMILGGNYVQAMATQVAKNLGYYVISTDLHEDNPGHRIADEYCKVDIINKDAVLKEAKRLRIDGIVPFCSDVLAPIAAYVQEKMRLPGNPYDVVHTMTHKDLFRKAMQKNGFLTPQSLKVTTLDDAICVFRKANHKLMLKPTDSAGSKGVFAIESISDIEKHWQETIRVSPSGTALMEDFIDSIGLQQDGDIFVIDGKIALWGMCDQYKRPEEPFVPAALVYPSTQEESLQAKAQKTVQEILTKIGFCQGPCNVEYLVDKQGQVWVIEIGPRNGGNLIPLLIEKSTGINITEMTVMQAVGDTPRVPQPQHLCNAMTIVHRKDGKTINLELLSDNKPLKPW